MSTSSSRPLETRELELGILVSPGFVVGVALLLLNDRFLKPVFHNWITGKLSDFSGLFVFPLLLIAFFPTSRKLILGVTTAGFIYWKSPYSQPLIDFSNEWLLYPIQRTVDGTDLIALISLPFSCVYSRLQRSLSWSPLVPYAIGFSSLFVFAATQCSHDLRYSGKEYAFTESRPELLRKIERTNKHDPTFLFWGDGYPYEPLPRATPSEEFQIYLYPDFCENHATAHVELIEKRTGSLIILKQVSYSQVCERVKDDKAKLLMLFERNFIAKLRRPTEIQVSPTPER